MHEALFTERNGHKTWLKWHRGRRTISDPVFTGARILEGMRLGASVEVDMVIHRERGFAILHDLSVEHETTGTGRVIDKSAAEMRELHLRDNDGQPIAEHVMLLEDLAVMVAQSGAHDDALLQLDYKEDAAALDARSIEIFRDSLTPVARYFILSSGDADAVRMLTDSVPGIRIGYDPCHGESLAALKKSQDFAGFVAEAVAASPKAEMIYLAYPVVLEAADAGFDIVGAFHKAERRIDAYTIKAADVTTGPIVKRLLDCKVDQITTDDPEGLGALIAGM